MLLNPMVLTVCCMQTIQSFMLLLTVVADNPPLQTLKSASLTFKHFSQKTNCAATPLKPRLSISILGLNFTSIPGINIGDHLVPISKELVCNLGAMFDKHLTMFSHINKICRSASLALRNSRVKKYLNQQSAERLVYAFITSRLDYCNSLLYGLPTKEINKLQRLQSSVATPVTRSKLERTLLPFRLNYTGSL